MAFRGQRKAWALAFLGLACSAYGEFAEERDAAPQDALREVELAIGAPLEGAKVIRDRLAPDGSFYTRIEFRVRAPVDVATISWRSGGAVLGEGRELAVAYAAADDGAHRVEAIAQDALGREVARAVVTFAVAPPPPTDCLGVLESLGVAYLSGPATPGVVTPVTVSLPLHGMAFRYVLREVPRTEWLMDCELALSLFRMAEVLATYGVVEVADIGLYNYRCIDQTADPPGCPGSRLSEHAHATAIDIAGLTFGSASYASVSSDWVIDENEATCGAETESAMDALLHRIVCELGANGIFSTYLTPNYNAAHRSHWHLDLMPGGDFLRSQGGVDSGEDDE